MSTREDRHAWDRKSKTRRKKIANDLGLCSTCLTYPRWGGRKSCKKCYERTRPREYVLRQNEATRKRRIRLAASGLCTRCGTPLSMEGATRCSKCKDIANSKRMKNDFGITLDEYRVLLARQGGVCAICQKEEKATTRHGGPKNLAIDHDHNSGTIRGLLCMTCNLSIGLLRDDARVIQSAIRYVQNGGFTNERTSAAAPDVVTLRQLSLF